jgi:hypothetical protein
MGEEHRRPIILQPPDSSILESSVIRRRGPTNLDMDNATARKKFKAFFRGYHSGDYVYIYRDALIRHWNRNELFVEVDLAHLNQFDEDLFNNLQVIYMKFNWK